MFERFFLANVYLHPDESVRFLSEHIPQERWMHFVTVDITHSLSDDTVALAKTVAEKWPPSNSRDKIIREVAGFQLQTDPLAAWDWAISLAEDEEHRDIYTGDFMAELKEGKSVEEQAESLEYLMTESSDEALASRAEADYFFLLIHSSQTDKAIEWVADYDAESPMASTYVNTLFHHLAKVQTGEAWTLVGRIADRSLQEIAVSTLCKAAGRQDPQGAEQNIRLLPAHLQHQARLKVAQYTRTVDEARESAAAALEEAANAVRARQP
ncbi:MAG TPA: hypothetical protein VMN36_07750 [Verrucomicrobiales bacterium]|nr:hypothetical protein [Verrucomicrobiales bacterium]